MEKYNLYWGDLHSNLHTNHIREIDKWYDQAKEILDFWAIVYYPFHMKPYKGFYVEDMLDDEQLKKDWEKVKDFVKEKDESDSMPVFAAYEWQGNGRDGDHNVFFLDNDKPMYKAMTYRELISQLQKGRAIAIPHHVSYQVGQRGKNWDNNDVGFTPFIEMFSSHGSSESDATDTPMASHIHMGPRTSGGSMKDGLERGNKVGNICSGDNHVAPAVYGNGYMACYAKDLSKESLFDAFLNRRVYGVTGDKIKLNYSLNGALMGSEISAEAPYRNEIEVEGGNAIHRIELYRNNRLIADYTHTGKWEDSIIPDRVKFKFKLECGWGADIRIFKDMTEKKWTGSIEVDGQILSVEKCWTNYGQHLSKIRDDKYDFTLTTYAKTQSGKWMGLAPYENQAFIFEIETNLDSSVKLIIDKHEYDIPVKDILNRSQLIPLMEEAKDLIRENYGFDEYYRDDTFWHNAYKIKIHQGVPEAGYKAKFVYEAVDKKKDEDFYMVKIYQRDGHKAWSSPIWVK